MYQIVPIKEIHAPQIAAIERGTFSVPWDEPSIRAELENPLAFWLVAEGEDGTVLGYVGSQTCFEDADILNVAVVPAARRRGIAAALMRELEVRLAQKGVERITLEVRASNVPAIRLYEGLGYSQVGMRKNYYEKPREDALILQKQLRKEPCVQSRDPEELPVEKEASFWMRSWQSFDPGRVPAYIRHLDSSDDRIIEFLNDRKIRRVCDAGCGCGAYSLILAQHGFSVSGFDVAESAVLLAKDLLSKHGYPTAGFQTSHILSPPYADESFDAVVARDVIDHLPIQQGTAAVKELLRITKPGGFVIFSLDAADDEYEFEPHEINKDGDYMFTNGKWAGMVFHPYSLNEIKKLTVGLDEALLLSEKGNYIVALEKQPWKQENSVL